MKRRSTKKEIGFNEMKMKLKSFLILCSCTNIYIIRKIWLNWRKEDTSTYNCTIVICVLSAYSHSNDFFSTFLMFEITYDDLTWKLTIRTSVCWEIPSTTTTTLWFYNFHFLHIKSFVRKYRYITYRCRGYSYFYSPKF